jgi:Domain of unknown function (DUF3387)
MVARNPQRMDYYKKYSEIIADYNREKDRVTIEESFAKLVQLSEGLDAEQRRAAEEGLSEEELALFDLLQKPDISKADRERVKQASKTLLDSICKLIAPLERWTEKEQTQAEVEVFILDHLFRVLPMPPFTAEETQAMAKRVYQQAHDVEFLLLAVRRQAGKVVPTKCHGFCRSAYTLGELAPFLLHLGHAPAQLDAGHDLTVCRFSHRAGHSIQIAAAGYRKTMELVAIT